MNNKCRFYTQISLAGLLVSRLAFASDGGDPHARELPYKVIKFVVIDAESRQAISEGEERISFDGGFISKDTVYWRAGDAQKKTIQEESCSFELKTLRPRYYKFQNQGSGESVVLSGDSKEAFAEKLLYRDTLSKPEVSIPFKWRPELIIGKTLHHVIARSWPTLIEGKPRSFELFVPMKREQYSFRVSKKSEAKDGGDLVRTISLEPDNWAFRQLAPAMLFHYSQRGETPTLIRYEGPTTVNIDNKPDRKVIINFAYES